MGSGYIAVQSIEAIRAAGFWGQRFTFPSGSLPDIHTEMIFTYITGTEYPTALKIGDGEPVRYHANPMFSMAPTTNQVRI